MDDMFQPSSGHRQVQYKEMWGSTELRTRILLLMFLLTPCTPILFLYFYNPAHQKDYL